MSHKQMTMSIEMRKMSKNYKEIGKRSITNQQNIGYEGYYMKNVVNMSNKDFKTENKELDI